MLRNTGFAVMAATIVWQGSPGPVDWFSDLSQLSQIVLLIGLLLIALGAVQAWLLLQVWRQNKALLARLGSVSGPALPVLGNDEAVEDRAAFEERPAQPFNLPALDRTRLTLQGLLEAGKPVLLLFVDPGCGPCRQLVPDVHEWHRRFASDIVVALISRGSDEDNREKFGDVTLGLQEDREVYDAYGVKGTPSGVLVHPDETIRDPYAPGRDRIRELVVRTMREPSWSNRELFGRR